MATEEYKVTHNENEQEFCIEMSDNDKCYLQYEKGDDNSINFYHTFVPTQHRGKGIAKILVEAGIEHCVERREKFRASCSYVQHYFSKDKNSSRYRHLLKQD